MNIVQSGNTFKFANDSIIISELVTGTYSYETSMFGPYLQKIDDIKLPEKIYSNDKSFIDHVMYTWDNDPNSLGITLEIQEEDAILLEPIMMSLGKWSIQKRKRKDSWKKTWTFVTNNKDLYNFLEIHDYKDKSHVEPSKILKLIPKEFIHHFWKGVIDGDGSIGFCGRASYFELSNTYNYDYREFNEYLSKFNIEGKIYRTVSKNNHKGSVCKVYGKKNTTIRTFIYRIWTIKKNK